MPCPRRARRVLNAAVYKRVSEYLIAQLAANAAAHPNPGSVMPVHRLTRTEYRNSIRDLLALRRSAEGDGLHNAPPRR